MSKKLIYLTCFTLVLSMAGHAWAELILHWKFDEDSGTVAYDSSGHGRDGVFEGNPRWVAGKIGGALEFSGGGERVVDEDAEDYLNSLDDVTISVWIKSNEINSDRGFIIGEEPDFGDHLMTMRYDAEGITGGGRNLLKMAVVAPNDEQQLESSSNLQTTEWQHVALVWSRNEQLKFYVNGEFDKPMANGAPRDVSTSNVTMLIVGQGGKDVGGSWNGLVDDVRIYDEALTAEQIQGVMLGEGYPYAMDPKPADGDMHAYTWVNLSWRAGDFAVSHDVYFGDNFDDVYDGTGTTFQGNQTETVFNVGLPGGPYPDGLVLDTTYYWRIDEVEADGTMIHKGNVWRFTCSASAALPVGWMSQDIGTTGGSADESSGTWTVSGDGADIWGGSDTFHYAYVPLSGDGMIVARVLDNGSGSDSWAKGGVMIRETLDANSKHAMMIVTGGAGAGKAFQCRPSTGNYSLSSHGGTQVSPPMWVKLMREGNLFTGYYSADGVDWEQQPDGTGWDRTPNPIEINMTRDVYIGVCVTSVVVSEVRTYTFDHVSTEEPKIALRPDPADGALYDDTSVSLSWAPGAYTVSHDVYLGDNFSDVNDGAGGTFRGNQTETYFLVGSPGHPYPEGLVPGTTYYWRVDEIGADGITIYKGDVWSFTIGTEAEFIFGTATNLGEAVNSAYWEASPSTSADGLALFFDSDRPGGSGDRDLYFTTRATKDDDWGRPVNLGQSVNTPSYDGQPEISADGLSLYFSSDRLGGFGNQDLWVTTRPTTDDEWGTPVNLESTVNSFAHDTEPSISADGLTLFFDSDRPGGYGSWDIWMVTRASTDDQWLTPVPLGPPVNSVFNEGEPSISADGRMLYLCSDRPGGYGTFDLWVATRETTDDEWGTPVNLGSTVNTTLHDWGASISADGSTLYFTAEHVRNLCLNDYDLWQVLLEVSGFEDRKTSDGFDLYLDDIAPNIIESSWFDEGILDYYSEDNPASGNYCIHWAGVGQYSAISFCFVPVKDLSVLVDEGYAIDFWVRCNSPSAKIDIRFVDTKADDRTGHPWRMRYTIDQNIADLNGQWNHLQIPLSEFSEHGSWDNDSWYNPVGAFEWSATEYFEIVSEFHDLTGIHFYFDDIRVVDPRPAGRP